MTVKDLIKGLQAAEQNTDVRIEYNDSISGEHYFDIEAMEDSFNGTPILIKLIPSNEHTIFHTFAGKPTL